MKTKHDIDFKYNLKVYWSFLRKYKGLFASLMFVILIVQSISVIPKYLFKLIIDNGTEYAAGSLAREAFVSILLLSVGIYVITAVTKTVLKWVHIHLINLLDGEMIVDVKRKFFNHILGLSYNFHTTHKTGSLISRLVRGGRAIEAMTDVIVFNAVPLIFQSVIVIGAMLVFDWVPALVVMFTVLAFIGYSLAIQQKQRIANVQANEIEDVEKGYVSDFFTNIDSIKYYGKERNIEGRFLRVANQWKLAAIKHWHYYRWVDAGHTFILMTGTFFIVYFPLMDFLDGKITLGTLTFIYTVFGNLIFPLYSFVHGIRNYYRAMADFESLFGYGKIHNEIKDNSKAGKLKIHSGTIEFKDVTFGYHKKDFFKDFNLTIPKNKKVALVGHSGCGKSTLIKLLYRLYDVRGGAILIDGKNIRDVKQSSLRGELSIVPQEAVLFDDTIYNNIVFSRPEANREEVLNAMKFAQLDRVVSRFPKKEKTIVGERGVKLSGGEKQRVSIARAILADKKVLVLDEATSALDSETEHEIQQDLEKLMQGRTSIIIAHRLSTIMKADMIVVMDHGRIVQKGTHRQLIRKPGQYRKLWHLQKGGYIK